jgi:Zn finger protein HypA/HybF involved in hydrogenase expression
MACELYDFEDSLPHKVSTVICLNCYTRWVAVRPVVTLLKNLHCPHCGKETLIIETGE